MIQQETMSQ